MSTLIAPQGMEGVVASDSSITSIDGERGELRYRGYSIEELAESCTFEDVVSLLWDGELPSHSRRVSLARDLHAIRNQRLDLLTTLRSVPRDAHPLDLLRYVVSWDALINPGAWDNSHAANRRK